jgi:hypothetical protein
MSDFNAIAKQFTGTPITQRIENMEGTGQGKSGMARFRLEECGGKRREWSMCRDKLSMQDEASDSREVSEQQC